MRQIRTCQFIDEAFEPCNNICEGNSLHCASHNYHIRKAEREAKKVKIVRPVNKVSEKRAGQNAQYMKLRNEYLALYPMCEVEDCDQRSQDVHHQRGKEGERLLDTNFFMAVCRNHHIYYTEHSKEAIEKGISVSRNACATPVNPNPIRCEDLPERD